MKKLSIFLAGMVAVLGFTGCEADKDPVYKAPTSFTMNQSALENQYLNLTEDGTFELVAAGQPDYGFSGITEYSALVSLSPEFDKTKEIKSIGSGTTSRMVFKSADLALAICELKGVTSDENYVDEPALPIYFRGIAELRGVPESRIISSNYVTLKQVKYYFAVPTPGYIYLVGQPSGWNEPSESNKDHYKDWRLFESDDAIGSQVYTGIFDIPASQNTFRFYTELTGWDGGASLGIQVDDNAMDVTMTDGAYEGAVVKGKGSWCITNWTGGEMTITVDLKNMTITMLEGAHSVVVAKYVYMVGNNAGWAEPGADNEEVYNDWRLADKEGNGIYTGTFAMNDIPEDKLYCRFYSALNGWGAAEWSSDEAGGNVDVQSGVPAPTFVGEGCFVLAGVNGHNLSVSLDTNANSVTFTIE